MAEREDTGFKVTDRRKYNPDGTPRESSEQEPALPPSDDSVHLLEQTEESAANNVLSFPGETKRQAEPPPTGLGRAHRPNGVSSAAARKQQIMRYPKGYPG